MHLRAFILLACGSSLASAVCPLFYIQIGSDCFRAYNERKSSSAASEDICAGDGGHLASIHYEDMTGISTNFPGNYLIGLKCNPNISSYNNCTWSDGSALDHDYRYDAATAEAYCYYLAGSSYREYTTSCDAPIVVGFICRVPQSAQCEGSGYVRYRNTCVVARTEERTFDDAEEDCFSEFGHLASVHSDEENFAYQQLAEDKGIEWSFWIGLKDFGTDWTDGTKVDFMKFGQNFPNDEFGNCTQVAIKTPLAPSGQWTSYGCDLKLPYVCVKPMTKTTTCDTLTYLEHTGQTTSPGYPNSFPAKLDCGYFFVGQTGSIMTVSFPHFVTDAGSNVKLYNGYVVTDDTIPDLTLSGTHTDKPTFNATGNVIYMKFTSSASPSGKGWQVLFNQFPPPKP